MNTLLEHNRADFKKWAGNDDLVVKYFEMRPRLKSPENDISYWINNKKPDDLEAFLSNYKSKNDKKKEEMAGAKKIYDKDGWLCIHCTTYDAVKHYGKGTKWCIAGNYPGHETRGAEYFNSYLNSRYSGYFVVINNNMKAESTGGFLNNKWCVCPVKSNSYDGSSYNKQADIWNAPDDTISCIEGVPEIPGIPFIGSCKVRDGVYIKSLSTDRGTVVVPDGITRIGPKALLDSKATGIEIPDSVTSIGYAAFANSSLRNVELSDNVTEIEHSAFMACSRLSEVVLGANIRALSKNLFKYCSYIGAIYIKGVIEEIDETALPDPKRSDGYYILYIDKVAENSKLIEFAKSKGIECCDSNGTVIE